MSSQERSVSELEQAWLTDPRGKHRGHGGRRSLSGFRYQFALSLERFITSVRAGEPVAASAFDGLSDLACLSGELFYLVQVKRTLDRGALRDALAEALALDAFLEERFPDWRPRTRFRIWCRRRRSSVEPADVSAAELGLGPEEAERLMALRTRIEPIEVRPEPYLGLVVSLFSEVPDPFLLVDGWLGTLLRLLGDDRPSEEIGEALLETWQAQRARLRSAPPGWLLQPADVAEVGAGHTDILVGERPMLEDLGRGCFMPRSRHLSAVLHAIDRCFAATGPARTVPVVWIDGASGVG